MSRILLINQGHTDNLGDQAIDAVLSGFLRMQGMDVISVPYEEYVEDRVQFGFDGKHVLPRAARHLTAAISSTRRSIFPRRSLVEASCLPSPTGVSHPHFPFGAAN